MNIPRLNVLLVSNHPYYYNTLLDDALESHPHVTIVEKQRGLYHPDLAGREINVLFIDPRVASDHSEIEEFIWWARKQRGEVRCVFFGPEGVVTSFLREGPREFKDYFTMTLEDNEEIRAAKPPLESILTMCRTDWVGYWKKKCHYDIALSYANTDAEFVSELVQHLKAKGIRVFDYNTRSSERIGENLREDTERIYGPDSRYCVLVTSEAYKVSYWCTEEAKVARQALSQKGSAHIIPIRIDNTELPGIEDLIYADASDGATRIAERIYRKLGYEPGFE